MSPCYTAATPWDTLGLRIGECLLQYRIRPIRRGRTNSPASEDSAWRLPTDFYFLCFQRGLILGPFD